MSTPSSRSRGVAQLSQAPLLPKIKSPAMASAIPGRSAIPSRLAGQALLRTPVALRTRADA